EPPVRTATEPAFGAHTANAVRPAATGTAPSCFSTGNATDRTPRPGPETLRDGGRRLRSPRVRVRARAADRPETAVPVLRADAGVVLGHGRAGRRLLRPVHAVFRPRANGVPPPPRADPERAGR